MIVTHHCILYHKHTHKDTWQFYRHCHAYNGSSYREELNVAQHVSINAKGNSDDISENQIATVVARNTILTPQHSSSNLPTLMETSCPWAAHCRCRSCHQKERSRATGDNSEENRQEARLRWGGAGGNGRTGSGCFFCQERADLVEDSNVLNWSPSLPSFSLSFFISCPSILSPSHQHTHTSTHSRLLFHKESSVLLAP